MRRGIRRSRFHLLVSHRQALRPVIFQYIISSVALRTRLSSVVFVLLTGVIGSLQGAEFQSLQLGYQGVGKVGKWLPVEAVAIDLPAGEAVELRAAFSDPRGDTCVEVVDRGSVGDDGTMSFSGEFKSGRLEGFGQILITHAGSGEILCRQAIVHGGKVTLPEETTAVHSTLKLFQLDVPFLITIGDVAGIEELLRNADNFSDDRAILHGVRLHSPAELPTSSRGLDAIDLLLLTDDFRTEPEQAAAIRNWVLTGGRLFVSIGRTVSSFEETELGTWLCDRFGVRRDPINVLDLSSMQSYVSGATVLQTNRESLLMAVMKHDQTVEDVTSLDGTIVGTQSIGAGVVTMIAVDLNQKPVSRWNSLPDFYEVLFFGKKFSRQTTQESRTSRISQAGVSDLATQMMATVDAVPAVGRWSTWAIMAMVVVYLLLIGPLDYLLVTHLLKRPHLTWLTFPLLMIGGATAVFMGAGTRGTEQLNQLHLVDIVQDGDAGHVHAQSWMSLSSPQTMRTDLSAVAVPFLSGGVQSGTPELMWSGRPEDIFGGMYRVGGIGLGRQSYMHRNSDSAALRGVPLLTNGSRELFSSWDQTSVASPIAAKLSVSGYGLLNGTFSHSLPFAISDWAIMHGNRVYRSRRTSDEARLAPGDVWEFKTQEIYASDLKAFLNASRLVLDDAARSGDRGMTQVITAYDMTSQDPVYVVTMATFYDIAGAEKYVGLTNSLLKSVELSDSIRMNHAVLIGLTDVPATNLNLGDKQLTATQSKTIVRLLIPVDRRPSQGLAPIEESKN